MTLLVDSVLVDACLHSKDELAGFRAAMSHAASRDPASLPMPNGTAADADRSQTFLRGARIAGRWRSIRASHREPRTATTPFSKLQENRRVRRTAFEQVVEASATEDGFPGCFAMEARRIGTLVAHGEHRYLLRDCVAFHHADGANGILAPVHPTTIDAGGRRWGSVEAIYQVHKHRDPEIRRLVLAESDPLRAKAAAKAFPTAVASMRGRFGLHRRIAMARAQLLRADRDHDFAAALLDTGARPIVEHCSDATFHDLDWGTAGVTIARGWNTQGRILEHVRDALRNGVVGRIGASA